MNLTIIDTDTGLTYELAEGVITSKINPLAYYLVMLTGKAISIAAGKNPVLTSGWRDGPGQLRAMKNMKATQPELYKEVYGPMEKRGQNPLTMPHPEGRAGDWLFLGFEKAESKLIEINGWLEAGAKKLLGYDPSRFIYPEKGKDKNGNMKVRCYHCQLPRQITNRQKLRDYFTTTFAKS